MASAKRKASSSTPGASKKSKRWRPLDNDRAAVKSTKGKDVPKPITLQVDVDEVVGSDELEDEQDLSDEEDEGNDDGDDREIRITHSLQEISVDHQETITDTVEFRFLAGVGGIKIKETANLQSLVSLVNSVYKDEKNGLPRNRLSSNEQLAKDKAKSDKPKVNKNKNYRGLDATKPRLSNMQDIFAAMAKRAVKQQFQQASEPLSRQPLRVVTMCSGTESPVLAMNLLRAAFEHLGSNNFNFVHVASAEIEPSKQAYIQRNFDPPVIFRDVTDFAVNSRNPVNNPIECYTAYGAKEQLPMDVDLVVAGSSCVDYSLLNKETKEFSQEGESKATMLGVIGFAERTKPAIVILENVRSAPWADIGKAWLEIGYYTQTVIVDSKNFYLPQTRNRGYVFAINIERAKSAGIEPSTASGKFVDCMTALQCRASAPYTDFLLPEDDMHLKREMRTWDNMEITSDKGQDWAMCRHRYAAYRGWLALGNKRPMTKWQTNGSCIFPDFGNQMWARLQRERIWDTLDISLLKYAAGSTFGYDMNFKCRFLNLSQNVDRDSDSRRWGIIGCLTPSGMPYDTRRVGPVIGREALALQGIPVDDLIIGDQNSKELQDLAGNAMTTTVVGAAICSAIVAARKLLKARKSVVTSMSGTMSNKPERAKAMQLHELISGFPVLLPTPTLLSSHPERLVMDIQKLATRSLPLCRCEVFDVNERQSFKLCGDCGHTACSACAGNPIHAYNVIPPEVINCRESASVARKMLIEVVPKSLTVHLEPLDIFSTIDPPTDLLPKEKKNEYKGLLEAVAGDTLHFKDVTRGSYWKVAYEGEYSLVELRFGPMMHTSFAAEEFFSKAKVDCQWLLYVKPSKNESAISQFRNLLEHPIARMVLTEKLLAVDVFSQDTLLAGHWEIWRPLSEPVKLDIVGMGDMQDAWVTKLGLQDDKFRDKVVSSELTIECKAAKWQKLPSVIQEICGQYSLHQGCGAAQETLYKRKSDSEEANIGHSPLFFFLDPAPLGDDKHDSFVFARDHERTTLGTRRELIAKLHSSWRPVTLDIDTPHGPTSRRVKCYVLDEWTRCSSLEIFETPTQDVADLHFVGTPESLSPWHALLHNITKPCRSTLQSFVVLKVPLNATQKKSLKSGFRYDLRVDRPLVMRDMSWILTALQRIPYCGGSFELCATSAVQLQTCRDCVPNCPTLEWKEIRRNGGKTSIMKPFESPLQAAKYEKDLKERPSLLTATLHVYDGHAYLDIKANILAVMHQTLGKLLDPGSQNTDHKINLSWSISPEDDTAERPLFEDLKLEGSIPNNSKDSTNSEVFYIPKMAKEPWPLQRNVVEWMWQREHAKVEDADISAEWHETEYGEVLAPSLGLRIDCKVDRPKVVCGGVVADEVGAGKTIISLALFVKDLLEQRSRKHKQSKEDNPSSSSNFIDSKATLILVPKNLVKQWADECEQWLKTYLSSIRIVTLTTLKELHDCSLEKIRNAHLIIAAWNILDDPDYWNDLGGLCCTPYVPPDADRAFEQWALETLQLLQRLVKGSDSCVDKQKFWDLQARGEHNVQLLQRFKDFLDRKRKKKQLQEQQELMEIDMATAEKELKELVKKWRSTNNGKIKPLLHMFQFRRLIVDEFTYVEGRALLGLINLAAPRRWLLSGTPPLTDFDDLNTMAKLLGTRIAADDEGDGIFHFGKQTTRVSHSYAEEFRKQVLVPPSAKLMKKRYEQAVQFVKTFMRKNAPEHDLPLQKRHLHAVTLSVGERTVYQEVCQLLLSECIRFHKKYSAKDLQGLDRQKALACQLSKASSPEEALITCLSSMKDVFLSVSCDMTATDRLVTKYIEEKQRKVVSNGKAQNWLSKDFMIKDAGTNERNVLAANFDWSTPASSVGMSISTSDSLALRWVKQIVRDEKLRFRDISLSIATRLCEIWGFRYEWMRCTEDLPDNFAVNPHFGSFLYNVLSHCIGDRSISEFLVCHILQGRTSPIPVKHTRASVEKYEQWHAKRLFEELQTKLQALADPIKVQPVLDSEVDVKTKKEPQLTELQDHKTPGEKSSELFKRSSELHNLALDLVDKRRRLRLFSAIETIIEHDRVDKCARCSKNLEDTWDAFVMAVCGHIVCKHCSNDMKARQSNYSTCLVRGCDAPASGQHYVSAASYREDNDAVMSDAGSKITDVVACVERILADKTDKSAILVFVQYRKTKDHLCKVLREHQVRYIDGAQFGERDVGKIVEDFKETFKAGKYLKGTKKGATAERVLLLRLDSPDSAGWNLQVASHVLFISPLVAASAYHYQSTMKQAIGRLQRYGQQRNVQVYQFAYLDTIEVNILEDQEYKRIIKRDGRFMMIAEGEELRTGDEGDRRGLGIEGAKHAATALHD